MLRRVRAALLVLVVLAVPRVLRAQELTLDQVVRLALARNERARIAQLGVTSAEAGVTKARAGLLPSVTLSGGETLRPYTVEQNGRIVSRSNAASGTLSVTQPLLAASAFPLLSSAKHSRAAARLTEVDQRRQLCFDAARAFFGVVAQQRLLAAAKRRLQQAEATLADTHARVVAQLASSNDETRGMVERASAIQSVAAAQGALEQSRISLEYVLDSPVTGELHTPELSLVPPSFDAAALGSQALAQRPDLASANESIAAANASAQEPSLRLIPTISAQGQERVADQPIAGTRYTDTTLQLTLNWQIWDAGSRSADEQTRKAAAATAALQMQALRRKIQADVRSAVASLTAARAGLEAAQQGVDAATRSAQETAVLYKQGLAKAIELFNASQSRFDAEVSLAAAQLSVRQAELDLRSALGLFPIDGVQ